MKIFNKWKTVKMTSLKDDKIYTANICPVCDAESVVQTNACSKCGTLLKGADRRKGCADCVYLYCDGKCHKCGHAAGDKHNCKCCITNINELCPFYESKSEATE